MQYLDGRVKVPESGPMHYLPFICILTSNIFWSLSWIHSNEYNISPIETSLIRASSAILLHYGVCCYKRYSLDLKDPSDIRIMLRRNIIITLQILSIALAQFILPLPIVHTLNCSGVLIIYVIDYYINGIRINAWQSVGLFIGFGGVILNANGDLIAAQLGYSSNSGTEFPNYLTQDLVQRSLFSLFMLAIIALWGFAIVETKKLQGYNSFQLNYHLNFTVIFASGIIYPTQLHETSLSRLLFGIIFTGIPVSIAQVLFFGGLTMSKQTGTLTMINFISVAIGYIISLFRYKEEPNTISLFGMFLVLIGVYLAISRKDKPVKTLEKGRDIRQ